MKIRNGFVSNSSSSSFIICVPEFYGGRGKIKTRENLDKLIEKIKVVADKNDWDFNVYKGYMLFSTSMDNFDMKEFLNKEVGRYLTPSLDIPQHSGFKEYFDEPFLTPGGNPPKYSCAIQNLRYIVNNCFWEMDMDPFYSKN